jgi:hypothetical protein
LLLARPPTAGLTPDAVNSRVEAWIEAEMRRIDPSAYAHEGNAAAASADQPSAEANARTASAGAPRRG